MKKFLSGVKSFFTKKSDARLRLGVSLVGIVLAYLAGLVNPEYGSFTIFITSYVATVAPDLFDTQWVAKPPAPATNTPAKSGRSSRKRRSKKK